jgi:hypothetical protein
MGAIISQMFVVRSKQCMILEKTFANCYAIIYRVFSK